MSKKIEKQQARRTARKNAAKKQAQHGLRGSQPERRLAVQRDATGRVHLLTLTRPIFEDAWQNDVAQASATTANSLLAAELSFEGAAALGRSAMAGTSKIADGVLARAVDPKPACGDGCAHCCYQAVGVSAPEVFAILQHLSATRSPTELETVTNKIRTADSQTRSLTSHERLSPSHPCPFLEGQSCTIYQARPLACRGQNSIDSAACKKVLHEPEARAEFIAGTFTIPLFVEPYRAFQAVAAGVQLALHELHALVMWPLELTAAMRVLLDNPTLVPKQWLAGEDPFKLARGGDSSQNPLSRKLTGSTGL